ncbi:hypothetical protein LUZ60_002684 [Juncus effusus]|nr:hypothetical protein LUZ60_002684 [Juncus effusus]
MSVFGGDSWARETQNRKRKVDDLLLSSSSSSSEKLSSGKYMCLVCPQNPVLDSPLMLAMHNKGSRHIASEKNLKEKELLRQQELDKRIALSSVKTYKKENLNYNLKSSADQDNPLVEESRRAILELQSNKFKDLSSKDSNGDKGRNVSYLEPHERREKELRFIAAGWKRDGFGKWYRDENVEFDSDEEDPNICFG